MADQLRRKPILLVDFDGVIHRYDRSWKDAVTIPDGPVEGVFEWLEACTKIFDVQIYSSRSKEPGGIDAMRRWMRHHICGEAGEFPEWTSNISFPTMKPPAFLTIDDRAITFRGNFSDVDPNTLIKFKPWNK